MKDMPAALPAGFTIAAALERGDARDAFVSPRHESLDALPEGARIGTSSLRRQCQLRHRRPDLEVVVLRGNVDTRLAKLDAGDCDATVLAAAGLERLGLESRIRARLAPQDMLPAIGQGIIGIECLETRDDIVDPRASARARPDALDARRRARVRGADRRQLPFPDRRLRDARRRRHSGSTGSSARPTARSIIVDAVSGPCAMPRRSAPSLRNSSLAAGAGKLL